MTTQDTRPPGTSRSSRRRHHARRTGCAWLVLIACTLVACSCIALAVLSAASAAGALR
jgi:hypothetical protein